MRATEMLNIAAELVGGDREKSHGTKLENFENIARQWSALLTTIIGTEVTLTPSNVCDMMEVMKVARRYSGEFNADDYIDGAGYAACSIEVFIMATRMAAARQKIDDLFDGESEGITEEELGQAILETASPKLDTDGAAMVAALESETPVDLATEPVAPRSRKPKKTMAQKADLASVAGAISTPEVSA